MLVYQRVTLSATWPTPSSARTVENAEHRKSDTVQHSGHCHWLPVTGKTQAAQATTMITIYYTFKMSARKKKSKFLAKKKVAPAHPKFLLQRIVIKKYS